MSHKLPRSLFNKEIQIQIFQDLVIMENQTYMQKKNNEPVKSLKMFNSRDGFVYLPYIYASIFLEESILDRMIANNLNFEYRGILKHQQEEPVNLAVKHLREYGTTTLHIRPGFGKTMISCYLSCKFNVKTLVLHSFSALNSQWLETFIKYSNTKPMVVENVSKKELLREKLLESNVVICMDTRFESIPKDILETFQFLIIDECHGWYTQRKMNFILQVQPMYIVAASATFNKANGIEAAMEEIVGEHRVRVDYENQLEVIRYNTKIVPELFQTPRGINNSALRNTLSLDIIRNNMICDIVERYPNKKILIMTWLSMHVEILEKLMKDRGISVSSYYGKKNSYKDEHVLIGTIKKIGTGFDQELKCDDYKGHRIDTVILAGSVKDIGLFEQIFGRGLRTTEIPLLIYMVDEVKVSQNHWKSCKGWIDNHNSKITIINHENKPDSIEEL